METRNYSWETTFGTDNEMIHTFSDRVKVLVNFKFETVTTVKDGEPVDKFTCTGMTIREYETFLFGIAKTAEILKGM
jgi:hypothetical protein